ncbi:MAG TPA: hypothetical protein VFZ62_02355 [Candidatus Saccharimonadales bacterium]
MKIASIKQKWYWVLGLLGGVGFIANVLTFYPGYMSNDTLSQLGQALGSQELNDMLPLAMMGLWRLLIAVTGHASAMLFFQLLLLWLGVGLLAVYVFRETGSRKYSLLPFAIGILPVILNISGVVWKDNQMAFALFLACVLILFFKYIHGVYGRIGLLVTSLMLMVYACLVRYNALIAIVPLMFLAFRQSGFIKTRSRQVLASLGMIVVTVSCFSLMSFAFNSKSSNPVSFVMLDDVVNVTSSGVLGSSSLSPDFKEDIREVQECARSKKMLVNNYWVCANEEQRERFSLSNFSGLKELWMKTLVSNPLDYMLYKTQSYVSFLFPAEGVYYVWQDGIEPNEFGQEVKFERPGEIVGIYVNNFGYKNFHFMYEPWFWLAACIGLFVYMKKNRNTDSIILLIVSSAALYLLSYFPTGATVDYRFIYWSVLACVTVSILLVVKRINRRPKNTRSKSRAR